MREVQFKIIPSDEHVNLGIVKKYFILEKETGDYYDSFQDKYTGLNAVFELIKYYKMPQYHNLELLSTVLQTKLPFLKNHTNIQKLLPIPISKTPGITTFKVIKTKQEGYFAVIQENEEKVIGIFDDKNKGLNIVYSLKNYTMPQYHLISLCTKILQLNIPFLARTQSVYAERKREFY